MKLLNLLEEIAEQPASEFRARLLHETFSILLRLLTPITPHLCCELWTLLGFPADVLSTRMPKVLSEALKADFLTVMVQVNGKLRGQIEVAADATEENIQQIALNDEKVKPHLVGVTFKKVIYVPGKLINLVVGA